jgi:hypothetical protein
MNTALLLAPLLQAGAPQADKMDAGEQRCDRTDKDRRMLGQMRVPRHRPPAPGTVAKAGSDDQQHAAGQRDDCRLQVHRKPLGYNASGWNRTRPPVSLLCRVRPTVR